MTYIAHAWTAGVEVTNDDPRGWPVGLIAAWRILVPDITESKKVRGYSADSCLWILFSPRKYTEICAEIIQGNVGASLLLKISYDCRRYRLLPFSLSYKHLSSIAIFKIISLLKLGYNAWKLWAVTWASCGAGMHRLGWRYNISNVFENVRKGINELTLHSADLLSWHQPTQLCARLHACQWEIQPKSSRCNFISFLCTHTHSMGIYKRSDLFPLAWITYCLPLSLTYCRALIT